MIPMIELRNVSYRYPEDQNRNNQAVLKKLSLRIEKGEFVALIGPNGSGKTTLLRLMKDLLLPTDGQVLVNGLDTRDSKNRRNIHSQVGMVFQNPEDQIVATRVKDDVAFGLENLEIPSAEIRERVDEVLAQMDLSAEQDREPHLLSAGQMQRLALAGVLATRPQVILFDEVTAMLDPSGRERILAQMKALNAAGLTIIFITHSMDEAARAKRILVLNQGELVMDGSPERIFLQNTGLSDFGLDLPDALKVSDQLMNYLPGFEGRYIHADELLKRLPEAHLPPNQEYPPFRDFTDQTSTVEEMIRVENLQHIYMQGTPLAHLALKDISFSMGVDGSHGLVGSTGSGKSTLLQHLNGLLRPQSGSVRVGPFDMSDPNLELRQVCQYAGLVIQNPETQFFEQFVGDEIAFGPRQIGRKDIKDAVRTAMQIVGLDFDGFVNRYVFTLSGGERRKVALASILALNPQILLLDEPFAGLDPLSHKSISGIFREIQSQGKTIILSSHRMEDIIYLTRRMTLLQKGCSLITGLTREVFYDTEKLSQTGILQPLVVQIVARLVQLGWPLSPGILTADELMDDLRRVTGRVG
jgi:energy-coupling factor transport system ATP-binding protein